MVIKSNGGETVTFNKLHLKSFSITQAESDSAPKRVVSTALTYGEDSNGSKQFNSKQLNIDIADFDTMVVEMLVADGVSPANIAAHLAAAKASVSSMDIAECMYAFERAYGLVFKHKNLFNFDVLE